MGSALLTTASSRSSFATRVARATARRTKGCCKRAFARLALRSFRLRAAFFKGRESPILRLQSQRVTRLGRGNSRKASSPTGQPKAKRAQVLLITASRFVCAAAGGDADGFTPAQCF
jgi:hypothetical protein